MVSEERKKLKARKGGRNKKELNLKIVQRKYGKRKKGKEF